MNPDTSKSSMTVNSLMQWGVAISILFPIILFALLAFISLNADHNAFLYVDTAFAFLALIVVFGVNQWVQRRVRERLASLADVCRDFSSGDRAVRAVVDPRARTQHRFAPSGSDRKNHHGSESSRPAVGTEC